MKLEVQSPEGEMAGKPLMYKTQRRNEYKWPAIIFETTEFAPMVYKILMYELRPNSETY